MATKSKKKNTNARFKAKKVATYDNRFIIITAISLAVIVAIIVTAVAINSYLNSFVCKVGGTRLMNFEYEMFLGTAKEEMEDEAKEADENFNSTTYWTDEKISEAKDKAMEDAIEWKSQFLVAKKAGYELTGSKKSEYQSTVESNLYYIWYVNYMSYYKDFSSFVKAYLGNISYEDYIKFALQDKAIADYRAAMQETYDQKADSFKVDVNKKFAEDKDKYTRICLSTLSISKGDAPKKVEEPTAPTKPTTEESETATEWIEYKANLTKYETNLKSYNEYLEKLEAYNKENAELLEKVQDFLKQMNEKGTYTGKGFVEVSEKDADGKETKAIKDYDKATLADIAKNECAIFGSTSGKYEFTSSSTSDSLFIDDFALSLSFNEDRTAIVSSLNTAEETKYEFTCTAKDGNVSTSYVIVEDDSYFYVTSCTGIKDLVTDGENAKAEDENSSTVWQTVAADVLSDYSLAQIKQEVADNSAKLAKTDVKENVIATVAKTVFGK